MTTNIQLLRSSVAFKRPTAAPLLDGQAAINLNAAEPGLFWRLTNGQLAKAGPVAITDNGMEPNAAPAGETGNALGEEWLDAHPALHAPILHIFNGTEFVTANGFTVDKSTGDLTLFRTLEVTKIVAGSAEINGNMILAGNLTPAGQNCAFYLGLPNERWDYLYSCNFDTSFDGKVGRNLTVVNDATVQNNLAVSNSVASNLIPDVDSTRHLGRSDRRWIGWFSSLDVSGSIQLGSGCSDVLTVTAKTKFECEVEFEQPILIDQIGNSCSDTLTVNASTTFKCPVTYEGTVKIDQIGESCSDTLVVNATTTFKCPVTFEQEVTFPGGLTDLNAKGNIILGDGCNTSTINLNGAVTLSCDLLPNSHNARTIGADGNRLKTLYSEGLVSSSGNITTVTSTTGNITNITSNTGSITTLTSTTGNIENITSTTGTISTFNSTTGSIDALTSTTGNITTVTSTTGNITNVNSTTTTTTNLSAHKLIGDVTVDDNARSIGTSGAKLKALYAQDVYTGDLHLKNEKGDWTMIEAEEYLTIRNNKTGKTFRLLMEEV